MHSEKILVRAGLTIFTAMVIVYCGGCFSSHKADIKAFSMPDEVDVTADSYILEPPDQILLLCSEVPELHLQEQRIRPDGKVSFQSVGELQAAGKTPAELSEEIKEKLMLLYALTGDHPVDVQVTNFESKSYYVLGQVRRPGAMPYTGRDTVLRAVSQAGLVPRSWEERIQVIRPSHDKNVKPKVFEINMDRLMAHGDASKNVLLQEGDIVFVPTTVFGAFGLLIDELLSPIGQTFSTVNVVAGAPARR
jgi:polysaccharide export outer membrane protein